MPEGDENPFLARPAENGLPDDEANIDPDVIADVQAMFADPRFRAEAEAGIAAGDIDREALRAELRAFAERFPGAAGEHVPENPRALGVADFFRTMLAPQDGGGGLQRAIARQNAPPREERED
jgi:hypothetical protein